MAYQDFLTRQIEQLGMVLRRLITGLTGQGDPGAATLAMEEARQALGESLGLEPGMLAELRPEALVDNLRDRSAFSEANVDLLADLLLAMAANGAARSPEEGAHWERQALALLEHLNATSTTFNMERHSKVARLRARL